MTTLVFDIGATRTRLAVTNGKTLNDIQRFDTDTTTKGLDTMLLKLRSYMIDKQVDQVIGGLPGQIDRKSGRLIHAANLPAWTGRRIGRELSQGLSLPVALYNDVELVGLGEATYGAGAGHAIVAYVTISSGVNGVRVTSGRIDPSRYGYEIGAQLVPGPGGRITSWEDVTGGVAMTRRYGVPPTALREDARVWQLEARYLAAGLYNTILHWSPDVVVLGGTMMRDISLRDVTAELQALPHVLSGMPALIRSALADDGGLYGAMAIAATTSKTAA